MNSTTEKAQLYDSIDYACQNLPDGWSIIISIEKGYAGVDYYAPDSFRRHVNPCDITIDKHIREIADEINRVNK